MHLSSRGSVSRSLAALSRLGLAREAEDLPHRLARALGAFGSLGTRALGRSHGASEPVVRRPRVRKVRCHVVGDEDGGALLGREGGVTAADDGDLSKAVVQELEHNLAARGGEVGVEPGAESLGIRAGRCPLQRRVSCKRGPVLK